MMQAKNKKIPHTVHSLHWNNIDKNIIKNQSLVFKKLNIPLEQHCINNLDHGVWMNSLLKSASDDEIIIVCDIDAFPMNFHAYQRAIDAANQNKLFGLAQFSAHTTSNCIYAGPMFMAIKKSVWNHLGSPSLVYSKEHDAGEILSVLCKEKNIKMDIVMPACCIDVKWPLSDKGTFGIGTFYGRMDYFHLFESRASKRTISLFDCVAKDVIDGKSLSFDKYISIYHKKSFINFLIFRIKQNVKRVLRIFLKND